jgi:hypothetical protein
MLFVVLDTINVGMKALERCLKNTKIVQRKIAATLFDVLSLYV